METVQLQIPIRNSGCTDALTVSQLVARMHRRARLGVERDHRLLDAIEAGRAPASEIEGIRQRMKEREATISAAEHLEKKATERGWLDRVIARPATPPRPAQPQARQRAQAPARPVARQRAGRSPRRVAARPAAAARKAEARGGGGGDGDPPAPPAASPVLVVPPQPIVGWVRPSGPLMPVAVSELPPGTVMLEFWSSTIDGVPVVDVGGLLVFADGAIIDEAPASRGVR